ncbi:MAG: Eco57I restriction-modification methylase domain-containing protein, partial [Promethearchaeota archaeon]
MANDLLSKVYTLLIDLPTQKESILPKLFYELSYEYVREDATILTRNWTPKQKEPISHIEIIASHEDFKIFWVRLKSEKLLRGLERNIINKLNNEYPYNLVIFSNIDDSEWDFVNVKLVSQEDDENKDPVKRKFVRRIKIEKTERLHTAAERITKLLIEDESISTIGLQEIHDEAFDVEKVTEKFFSGVVRARQIIEKGFIHIFKDLNEKLSKQTDDREWAHNFTMQFLSRIMFFYFIQKKRWLGDNPEFLKCYWEAYRKSGRPKNTFVSEWLPVLFFESLNKRYSHPFWIPKDLDAILQNAPFLNGGLFTRNDWDDQYPIEINDRDFKEILDFFQRFNFTIAEDSPIDQEVAVDPEMIGKVYESLVNVSEEIDTQGEAGIFYTPRTEITLMCSVALVDRLSNEIGKEYKNLLYEMVFAYSDEEVEQVDGEISNENLWEKIDNFLRNITIIDPAVGSGSFLVGMLTLITNLSKRANYQLGIHERDYEIKKRIIGKSLYGVDVMEWAVRVCELRLWLQLVVETDMKIEERTLEPLLPNMSFKIRVGDSLVQQVGGLNFAHLKLSGLPHHLLGKITTLKAEKLKFFDNEKIRKFKTKEQGFREELNLFRSILDNQIQWIKNQIVQLEEPQEALFGESERSGGQKNVERSKELEEKLERLITARKTLKDRAKIPFVWDISFVEIFEGEKEGFDIVLGNPPYVRQELISDPHEKEENYTDDKWRERKKLYKEKLIKSIYQSYPKFFRYNEKTGKAARKMNAKNDLYVYFYIHGLSLLNNKGSFCFVTSNSWLDVGYGKDLQEFLIRNVPIRMIIDNQV